MLILETPFWVAGAAESVKIGRIGIGASNKSGRTAVDRGSQLASSRRFLCQVQKLSYLYCLCCKWIPKSKQELLAELEAYDFDPLFLGARLLCWPVQ